MNIKELIRTGKGFLQWKILGNKIPLFVTWRLTYRCNNNCIYCKSNQLRGDELSTNKILAGIKELAGLGCIRIHFTGGEPLLKEDIAELVNYASKYMSVSISTNGLLLEKYINKIKIDFLHMSLDGNKNTHNLQRGDNYSKVLASIKLARMRHIPLIVNMTLTKYNYDQLDFILDLSKKMDFFVTFQQLIDSQDYARDITNINVNEMQRKGFFRKVIQMKKKYPNIIMSGNTLKQIISKVPITKKCYAGNIFIAISPDGFVKACEFARDGIKYTDSIQEAINKLPDVKCSHCKCVANSELNNLFNLNHESISNILRLFKLK